VRLSLVPKEQDYFRLFQELAANLDAAVQKLRHGLDAEKTGDNNFFLK
jgi:hypothetical protein